VKQGRTFAPARLLAVLVATLLALALVLLQGTGPAVADTPTGVAPAVGSPATATGSATDTNTSAASTSADPTVSAVPTSADPGSGTGNAPQQAGASDPGSSTTGIQPSDSSVSSGISVVNGGNPSTPPATDQPMPSTAPLRQAITSFLSGVLGSAVPVAGLAGQSAVSDVASSDTAAHCRCTVALAISVGSSAVATAVPGAGPAAPAVAAQQTSVGSDVPSAEVAGSTGNATSVSLSGKGPAAAVAISGDSGVAGSGPSIGHQIALGNVTVNSALLGAVTSGFTSSLLNDLGPAAATLPVLSCITLICGPPPPISVDVQAYVPDGSTCAPASSSAEWCTIAIAISLGGPAHARVASPSAAANTACTVGEVGRPTAIAIGVGGPASALARMGSGGGSCPITGPGLSATTGPVQATSGSTGDALAIGVAQTGPSGASSTSGNSGAPRAITDGTGNGLLTSSATATTGDTGEAVGIAVGKTQASALVHSGSSGRAAAVCTHCSLAGGETVAEATTGRTGGSYSLAVAGADSFSNALSGDSGDAASWAVHGTAQTFLTGQDTRSTPDSVVTTTDPNRVYVAGRSGDTGNVVATATDLLTWVSVLTQSGDAGPVVSNARWNADGCTLIFATFTMVCSANASTEPVSSSGSQKASDPVVSTPDPGVVVLQRGTAMTNAPESTLVTPAGPALETPSTTSGSRAVAPAAGQASGQGTDGHGGARTRLVSNDVARSAVSPAAFSPLSSWWGLLTLCVFASFLVALILIACRYGRPRNMNTG
jgi:hypothetical protein